MEIKYESKYVNNIHQLKQVQALLQLSKIALNAFYLHLLGKKDDLQLAKVCTSETHKLRRLILQIENWLIYISTIHVCIEHMAH